MSDAEKTGLVNAERDIDAHLESEPVSSPPDDLDRAAPPRRTFAALKFLLALLLITGGGLSYYLVVYLPERAKPEIAYALSKSVYVLDAPAQLHAVIDTLRQGDPVEVRARTRNWVRVRLADGAVGWVEAKSLLDAQTYQTGQRLLKECGELAPQASGYTVDRANLRVQPSREAPNITELVGKQKVELFGRRLVERSPVPSSVSPDPNGGPGPAAPAPPAREAWYLVRADAHAGWVLGRLVELDIPEPIAVYGQGTNLVAWLVLNHVDDGEQRIPQYLVADRGGTQEVDFNHIRVLTWWKKRQRYATAYVEGRLRGYFPIRVVQSNAGPLFRLRLTEDDGRKIQKVYGLFDTVVRPLGIVEGWENTAVPIEISEDQRGRRREHGTRRRS